MSAKKSVLITGCSEGGIGYALAKEFQANGLRVFATARSLSKVAPLKDLPNVTVLPLDVTSPGSITAVVPIVSGATGGKLDYLVNNSGLQVLNPLLDSNLKQARDMFEVNLFGAIAMVQAFAPLLIAAEGCVVNMTSITALMSPPWMGFYAGSKSAFVTVSECLRLELQPLGVRVVTINVGAVKTNIFNNAPAHYELSPGSVYGPIEKQIGARVTGNDVSGQKDTPEVFARVLVARVLGGATGKVSCGKFSTTIRVLTTYFPTWIIDRLSIVNTGLDTWK
ncbi:oxidoreductase [Annulohypoxylon maeteangense]|uniref:oxidoreductase n=1 Tax=Annulohypoxylon maeteangense TaxID=1927788 RepID=UPI0020086FF9|nr:oxidoreductase [Annulohypoxylon maeteangense]KAI0881406.1 oxidoreductase [Annulohypoxylon maeteangense]